MIPLESSALAMTLIALERALWVTAYTSAGSVVGIAASRLSTASCICRPCAFDALHRDRSARVRISGRTASASVVTVQILCKSLTDTTPTPMADGLQADPCLKMDAADSRLTLSATERRNLRLDHQAVLRPTAGLQNRRLDAEDHRVGECWASWDIRWPDSARRSPPW